MGLRTIKKDPNQRSLEDFGMVPTKSFNRQQVKKI